MWQNYTNGINYDNCKVDMLQNIPNFHDRVWYSHHLLGEREREREGEQLSGYLLTQYL